MECARRNLVVAKLSFHQCRSDDNKLGVANRAKALSDLYVQKENSYYAARSDELLKLTGDHQYKAVWAEIDNVSGRKARVRASIYADSEEERVKLWVEHFRKLLSPVVQISSRRVVHPPVLPNIALVYNTDLFTMSEI